MSTKLNLKTAPNLVLNPVVHSFLEFLPLNRTEFEEKIKNEVESNPMLEIENAEVSPHDENKENNDFEKKMERADSSFINKYEENGFFKRDSDKIDKNRAIELFTAQKTTLSDHLMNQECEYDITNENRNGSEQEKHHEGIKAEGIFKIKQINEYIF